MMDSNKFYNKLYRILYDYFEIGDSYTYELTRAKTSPCIECDDFEEWDGENIEYLVNYIMEHWNEVE